jgi:thioredoxin-dependent peroxiredoxin
VVGFAPNYPMIGDTDLKISKAYGMLPASITGTSEGRTPADNQTVRNVFIIGPDKKIKLILVYPMTTGRNFDEVLRVLDSLQLTAKHRMATPANWKQGEDVIMTGAITDDEAKKLYPAGWKQPKPYIRIVPQPPSHLSAKFAYMTARRSLRAKDRHEQSCNPRRNRPDRHSSRHRAPE